MEIKYIDKDGGFGSGIENEIIEIKDCGSEIYIEAIIKANSFSQAANTFFEYLYDEKERSRCVLCLDFEKFQSYINNLVDKKKNTRRNQFKRFGYSWQIDMIEDNKYYICCCYRLFQNKYMVDLREAITKYNSRK